MLRDLRFALHLIVKDRWYSSVAIVALSLGIGVNATVFTLVNAVLIRGLPYKDSQQLYILGSQRKDNPRAGGLSYLDFRYADLRWRDGHPKLAAWHATFEARASVVANPPVDDR